MDIKVYNVKGQEEKTMNLPLLFDTKVSSDFLHEIVVAYLNNQRQGTHKTKTRGEVSFSGAKPWQQKGTGRARSGQRNSPLWRKGGVIFGPQNRDYYTKISKQKKRLAISMAFATQFNNENIVVVDTIKIDQPKTKKVAELIKNLKLENKKVLLIADVDPIFKLAARNIPNLLIVSLKNVNAYQVLWAQKVVIASDVVNSME
ncbi:MAG: 50S ribosomal protein L4 [Elusimicrobiota bacterium]|jgi:large subunit ribosomal protein L4|nr:50S ribosomal protein L4 [Elusimicrobiota bacterium]